MKKDPKEDSKEDPKKDPEEDSEEDPEEDLEKDPEEEVSETNYNIYDPRDEWVIYMSPEHGPEESP